MKTVHIKNKKAKTVSLLIIPHSKEISQINIATWIPKFSICLIMMVLLVSGYLSFNLYTSYNILKQDYSEKSHKLETLEVANQQQRLEIENLRSMSAEVQEKLDTIDDLQEIVKGLVGLEDTSEKTSKDKEQSSSSLPSRGGPGLRGNYSTKSNFESQIKELSSLLDKSSEELSSLINDVEAKLKYLDAKPNLMPTTGKITSGFGYRKNPFGRGREFHNGLDIANNSGTKIKAAGSGVVTFAGYNSSYGRYVMISHGYGYQSVYGHNRKILVKVGDKVEKGQIISEMGSSGRSTGPHLHFEVRLNGNPVDPVKVIDNMD
ncbi:M23 family metallopeptidase [Proteiniborus sp. MB09-C3]|uniref:M23 family metallopeptidase n=1 Tax=Proteiniborus sp. MB09-C3 TaxID=3050072 RepID=UPI0025561495|nr:M23 family metallopeptidase [Proteiniborus sp. MB09-C3]WIV10494.1 peptidoglycan DD-metalloendopeptidase family protein [Proteiniborus sp. MB09-C3]